MGGLRKELDAAAGIRNAESRFMLRTSNKIRAVSALGVASALFWGCGQSSQTIGSGGAQSGSGAGVITVAGGGGATTMTGSGAMGAFTMSTTSSETSTETNPPKLGAPYPIVLCHGFFGFDNLANIPALPYFYNVPERLEEDGELLVYTPDVDPFNSSTVRAEMLILEVEQIIEKTNHEKVILIGHSQGGLDARAVAHLRPDLVAAVMTVATPHLGSGVADIALGLTEDPLASKVIDDLVKVLAGPLFDEVGDETSISKALHEFTQPGIAAFNETYTDSPEVFYASIGGRTDYSLGGQACASDVDLPWMTAMAAEKDPCDPLFFIFEGILDGKFGENIPNDGLVTAESARWGEFWGCVPADHMDEVGQLVGDNPGLGNSFDHEEMFSEIVKELRKRGY